MYINGLLSVKDSDKGIPDNFARYAPTKRALSKMLVVDDTMTKRALKTIAQCGPKGLWQELGHTTPAD
jgi:hypothetical protein